jgi:5-formyltetrahydrofolate cyclo-ligase
MSHEISPNTQKSAQRKQVRALRNKLSDANRQSMDSALQRHLIKLVAQKCPRIMTAYWPFDGEPNLLPALNLFLDREITLALPVLQQSAGGPNIIFRQWSSETTMINSRFGIPEPTGTMEIPLSEIDMVLLPLVAWDESGGRLGMGGGFYDRALQPFRQENTPLRVGIAYQLQRVSQLVTDPWDINLHIVVSESGIFAT